ncbi:MAG: NADH-quinone oxidoreductase subunit M [Polyangiaceae bacterium UTPRO1]|jgi:NADH-quinone oxidoreductase subunit M|nr:NADH-quinone oxidoreductase subunit M [Myxococcales bacterium]OQY69279.1 MAG: NADH-quinone oxidoreductase subunit M [Polyangiaceae bacterium UTPRO1]
MSAFEPAGGSGNVLLSLVVWTPMIGAFLVLLLPREQVDGARRAAFVFSLITFLLSLGLWAGFRPNTAEFQFLEQHPWIPEWGIQYLLGIDGVSLFLVLLTTFLTPLVILFSFDGVQKRVKEYFFFMLALETGLVGTFVALDLFLFYVFWELMLVPMYFIIGIWGGQRRIYASIKFLIYTLTASLLMLLAILYLVGAHARAGAPTTFDVRLLYDVALSPAEQGWLFAAFAVAFAVKVPMFPLHTWLPDAHVEAPTGGSVILASVMLKLGTYGFLRFAMPLFPTAMAAATPFILALAVVGIVYGAMVAMVQPDLKKLVAYSSVSHLGFVMLGLFALNPMGIQGAIYQMLNHGLSTGALFLLVGMIYERRHTRLISDFGGLWKPLPRYAAVFMVVTLSSIGLPGLNGFVGEFLILLGAFGQSRLAAVLASSGLILGAVYMLWMFQRVFFGPVRHEENMALADLRPREVAVLAPVVAMIVVMGVYPKPFLEVMEPSVKAIIARMEKQQARAVAIDGQGAATKPARGV